MSDNIPPFEIQLEIIKKVSDAKSLLRFRSVSKPWRSFIDSSDFIAGFRGTQPQRSLLLLRYQDNKTYENKYLCFDDDENKTLTQQQDFSPSVTDFMKEFSTLNVVGSSHGLLCLNGLKGNFILWNPFIRKSVGIQLPYSRGGDDFVGFLVCPVTNDPTIVTITYPWNVGLFKLSSKRFTVFPYTKELPPNSFRPISSQVVVNDNCIYWAARDTRWSLNRAFRHRCRYMIVSFDSIAKDIRLMDIPHSCLLNNRFPECVFISKLRESLVLVVPNDDVDSSFWGVWKVEHDESFTNLFTIISPPFYTISNILGFRKNGKLVLETVLETEKEDDEEFAALKVYDPPYYINLGIYGERGSFFLDSYKETLLLLNHSDGCIYPDLN